MTYATFLLQVQWLGGSRVVCPMDWVQLWCVAFRFMRRIPTVAIGVGAMLGPRFVSPGVTHDAARL